MLGTESNYSHHQDRNKHYLKYRSSFSPNMELYKKLHFNPKIYKLAKIFTKSSLNYIQIDNPRRQSLDNNKIPQKKKNLDPPETNNTKIPHLPKLPTLHEKQLSHAHEFQNLKLAKKPKIKELSPEPQKNRQSTSRNSSSLMKASVQTFSFNPLNDIHLNAFSKINAKLFEDKSGRYREDDDYEESMEKTRRKIIFSKRNQSINVKDFGSFYDSQDNYKGISSSLSNS
ncbi:hypothetical protein SteCoe_27448 [Stentor coeruleus]|uniref:Uncharacterized protein n=1 Tax=Stentor coeruleus TaxID=5963 RepID=A0A1R2BAS2_9CILI|nr:hypothetical protein SteCoe_27448 [Stentor coeruleus]